MPEGIPVHEIAWRASRTRTSKALGQFAARSRGKTGRGICPLRSGERCAVSPNGSICNEVLLGMSGSLLYSQHRLKQPGLPLLLREHIPESSIDHTGRAGQARDAFAILALASLGAHQFPHLSFTRTPHEHLKEPSAAPDRPTNNSELNGFKVSEDANSVCVQERSELRLRTLRCRSPYATAMLLLPIRDDGHNALPTNFDSTSSRYAPPGARLGDADDRG